MELRPDEALRRLSSVVSELLQLCMDDPEAALPEIKRVDSALTESGMPDYFGVHLLRFTAFGSLAAKRYDASGRADTETLDFCEVALIEYDQTVKTATYAEEETYTEKVVVKPGGFFRRPITEDQQRTRRVVKTHFDPKVIERSVDYVARLLERSRSGRVHQLCGEVKLKYLAAADRVVWAPIIESALQNDTLSRNDMLTLGEIPLKGSEPIGGAMVSWMDGGKYPKLMASCLSPAHSFPPDDPHIVAMYLFEKTDDGWDTKHLS